MKKINMNKFAERIAAKEGGKVNLSIAQIKEVLKCAMREFAKKHTSSEILEVVERYKR